jgi:hypothetical protein
MPKQGPRQQSPARKHLRAEERLAKMVRGQRREPRLERNVCEASSSRQFAIDAGPSCCCSKKGPLNMNSYFAAQELELPRNGEAADRDLPLQCERCRSSHRNSCG